ncbi:uncharacterized protein LOC9646165 isoform X2 [Selaginella moellendorffii]|uniref:uncharacterized protein LOC9646165 isoform X2 n=1 Tax=Selaginella moellendorffii TaxID=88036 RepID=UPI000D1CF26D|nr:uncharacterized protein LOC9646165 isoform X2 [Selaginella moellendorffii]|eukprot:XP_024536671.1 uncharacterized protein LOC9646165 isoform X2 [Selaginella moellendorffii]
MGRAIFFLVTAAIVIAMKTIATFLNSGDGATISYAGPGFVREGCQWDANNERFLVSRFEGGISELVKTDLGYEQRLVVDLEGDFKGNSTLGIRVDPPRNRLLAVVADAWNQKRAALIAYDLATWETLFVTNLESPDLLLADDVAVDPEGNAYVTEALGNFIWKIDRDGNNVANLSSPVFTSKPHQLPFYLAGLNGIDYHPDGFLLAIHTWSGALFKVSLDGSSVEVVKAPLVAGGDGIALLSPDKLVVAGVPGARLLKSSDGWKSARLTHTYVGPFYRVPSAVTIKDGKAFVSHMFSWWNTFTIKEAIFAPVRPKGSSASRAAEL